MCDKFPHNWNSPTGTIRSNAIVLFLGDQQHKKVKCVGTIAFYKCYIDGATLANGHFEVDEIPICIFTRDKNKMFSQIYENIAKPTLVRRTFNVVKRTKTSAIKKTSYL